MFALTGNNENKYILHAVWYTCMRHITILTYFRQAESHGSADTM